MRNIIGSKYWCCTADFGQHDETCKNEGVNPPNKERWHGDVEDPLHHSREGGLANPFFKSEKVVDKG